uniref:Uncharacterized protein n=1 Tax=Desertifilum tharense IPPAS B-1220 TaxID=1781255 RepID=A0ACD5GSM0_9CYAN
MRRPEYSPRKLVPTPGEANLEQRYRLQRDLESTLLGRALLHLAGHVKQVLQHQDRYQCKLGKDRTFHLRRKELEMQVFLPFMRRLNQEFNALLSETGVATQGIQQAMCTGGTASIGTITRWLRQKLPSAAIIQDTYPARSFARLQSGGVWVGDVSVLSSNSGIVAPAISRLFLAARIAEKFTHSANLCPANSTTVGASRD